MDYSQYSRPRKAIKVLHTELCSNTWINHNVIPLHGEICVLFQFFVVSGQYLLLTTKIGEQRYHSYIGPPYLGSCSLWVVSCLSRVPGGRRSPRGYLPEVQRAHRGGLSLVLWRSQVSVPRFISCGCPRSALPAPSHPREGLLCRVSSSPHPPWSLIRSFSMALPPARAPFPGLCSQVSSSSPWHPESPGPRGA